MAADLSVKGEGPMLSQLLANLIQNAINHSAAGNVITLGADSVPGAVRIWVADTGLGIVVGGDCGGSECLSEKYR